MDALNNPTAFHGDHLIEQALCALGRAAAQMAFAALRAYQFARPSQTKAFGSRLMGFYFVLTSFLLSGHGRTPLT